MKALLNYYDGLNAEKRVETLYNEKGFITRVKRFKTKQGEIDLIVENATHLIFIEVKKRKTLETAAESITLRQRARLFEAAEIFLSENPTSKEIRFDAALVAKTLEIIENAFA